MAMTVMGISRMAVGAAPRRCPRNTCRNRSDQRVRRHAQFASSARRSPGIRRMNRLRGWCSEWLSPTFCGYGFVAADRFNHPSRTRRTRNNRVLIVRSCPGERLTAMVLSGDF